MVGSIGPAVSKAESRRKILLIHTCSLLVGSILVALALVLLGSALRAASMTMASKGLVLGTAALAVFQLFGIKPPQSRWQVPDRWRYLMDVEFLAASYGFLLGLGFLTRVVVASFWVLATASLVVSPLAVVAAWGGYALTRSLTFWRLSSGTWPRLESAAALRSVIAAGAVVSVVLTASLSTLGRRWF